MFDKIKKDVKYIKANRTEVQVNQKIHDKHTLNDN